MRGRNAAPMHAGAMQNFYTSAAWLAARQRALRRDGYLCVRCARYGRRTLAELVHHKIPVEVAPEKRLRLDNLQSLCIACHNAMHPEKGSPPSRRDASRSSP